MLHKSRCRSRKESNIGVLAKLSRRKRVEVTKSGLSRREMEIAGLIWRNPLLQNVDLAIKLGINTTTLNFHVKNIMRKWRIENG